MADAGHPGVGGKEGSLRSTWWIGPIGVLMGFVVALVLVLSIDPGQAIPLFFTFSFLVIPATSGYAFRAVMRRSARATFSSIGTAVGWMLFVGLLIGNPGGLGFTLPFHNPETRTLTGPNSTVSSSNRISGRSKAPLLRSA